PGHHPHPLSFPTRRSSDLTSDAASNLTVGGNITGNFELAKTGPGRLTLGSNSNSYGATVVRNGTLAFGETARSGNGNVVLGDRRSEEHTSELQSRENLVCR